MKCRIIKNMKNKRFSGVLLHPTSLPGRYGIGDFGNEAYRFADFLSDSSVKLWQILPLGPTGYGNSPYSARSTFAGNTYLISLDLLMEKGLLTETQINSIYGLPDDIYESPSGAEANGRVDFSLVELRKKELLIAAAGEFINNSTGENYSGYEKFCADNSNWLNDYALFAVATEKYNDSRWFLTWEQGLGYRDPEVLTRWFHEYADEIQIQKVLQYFFYDQWAALKQYVNRRGIELIGDVPIFAAADSADTWVNLNLFKTNENGKFSAQSGVPPDFFSETGQLWGTPVYDWDHCEEDIMQWWVLRIRKALEQTDIVRIDHFRGLEAYWEVESGEETAINGKWVKAPGRKLFMRIQNELGNVSIIAEDLGVMTPEVIALREEYDLPGMKILQFAFEKTASGVLDASNDFLPHNYPVNCVAYTGTHDNDTTLGWYMNLDEDEKDLVRRYLARSGDDISWSMMRQVMVSQARYAIFPMQDLLALGADSRMNIPSTVGISNWSWRMMPGTATAHISSRFSEMVKMYGRS